MDEVSVDRVFDYGDNTIREFDRNGESPCFCKAVEARVGPVTDVVAADGTLWVPVHPATVAAIRELLRDSTETFGDVSLESLVRADDSGPDVVPVDLSRLTDRQRELLRTVHEMGYFAYPRDANARAVAAALDIDPSIFSEHVSVGRGKLVESVLES